MGAPLYFPSFESKLLTPEMHWEQQVYYRTIRITKILGRREHDCQVVVNMGADKSNISLFKTSIFTLALISTETFAQIVQNGGFESGK